VSTVGAAGCLGEGEGTATPNEATAKPVENSTATDGQNSASPDSDAGPAARFDAVEADLPTLRSRLEEAREAGHAVDYEHVNLTVIERFLEYGRADLEHGKTDRATYMADEMEQLYAEAMTNLEGYLGGDLESKVAPRYQTGRPEIEDYHFRAPTQTATEDDAVERPVFFTGYGHFEQVREDIPNFKDFGNNAVQIQIPLDGTVTGIEDGEIQTTTETIEDDTIANLEQAAEHDVSVNLLLAPQHFPEWAYEEWPDIRTAEGEAGHFTDFVPWHPRVKRLIETHVRTVMTEIRDYESLHSVTLTNEPAFHSRSDQWTQERWPAYLEDRHGSIETLNAAYESDFASFDDVPTGYGDDKWNLPKTPRMYDWSQFTNQRMAEWHEWMAGVVREVAPDVPVHTKIRGSTFDFQPFTLREGTDAMQYTFTDINGNDAWALSFKEGEPADHFDRRGFVQYLMQYDLQTSAQTAPVFNSEHHLIDAGDEVYAPEQARHVALAHWQSMLHRGGASTMWVWRRTYDESQGGALGSILNRPDGVAAIGHTTLDANRLAEELLAFQDTEREVGLLFSIGSNLYSDDYLPVIKQAYAACMEAGHPIGFVDERALAEDDPTVDGTDLEAYDVLVLAEPARLRAGALEDVAAYAEGGGDVLVLGDLAEQDPWNQELPTGHRETVQQSATTVPADSDRSEIRAAIRELSAERSVEVVDAESGASLPLVEWRSTSHDGRRLVNVANYTHDPVTVEIRGDEGAIEPQRELITDTAVSGNAREIPALTAKLFELP
jgi:hypothetical protein